MGPCFGRDIAVLGGNLPLSKNCQLFVRDKTVRGFDESHIKTINPRESLRGYIRKISTQFSLGPLLTNQKGSVHYIGHKILTAVVNNPIFDISSDDVRLSAEGAYVC